MPLAFLFVFFATLMFLSPAPARAARLAGEEQPVTTAPAMSVKAPEPKGVPAKGETPPPAAAVPDRKAASSQPPVPGRIVAPPQTSVPPRAAAPGGALQAATPASSAPPRAAAPAAPGGASQTATPASSVPPPPGAGTPSPMNSDAAGKLAQSASAPSSAPSSQSGRYVTIDFDNVDITVFIKFVSELTGRNFVIDEKVKGKVTVISPKKIAVDEVYKVFESVLEIYGFTTVQAGEVIKVIPALDARGKNMDLLLKREDIAPEDKIVTQILSLQHATPDDMKKVLDPLISKTSVILSYPPTGMLIITDVLSNVKRLQEIVTALDVVGVGELISYVPLKYASATEIAKSLTVVFQQQAIPGRRVVTPIKIVPDSRANALIILALENDMTRIRELVNLMDREIPRGAGTIRVYYLQNAKAEDLVKVLTGLPQQPKTAAAAGTAAAAAAAASNPASVFSQNVQVMADKATNSLIITAETADYLIIEDVIRKLDISRPMVYLEALIMEVNADKKFNVGVEWAMLKNANISAVTDLGGQSVGVAGFTGAGLIPQVGSSGAVSIPSGFSLGVIGAGISIGGVLFPNIGAVLNAYQNDADVRILSTPQLLTLDNEEAEITVGQNIPYVARQDTGVVGSTTNYSSYEYKDVGVTLKVTPQINKDGFVRMKLDQTVTKIVNSAATVDAAGSKVLTPTTLNRKAKTTVVVKSGETVVIGGMIQDDSDKGTSQVPLLGDIPLLGWLFKSRASSNTRNNLFVFITPRIIEQPEDAGKIKDEKMDYLKAIQEGTIRTMPQKKTEAKEKE